jgi:hypothetical protein
MRNKLWTGKDKIIAPALTARECRKDRAELYSLAPRFALKNPANNNSRTVTLRRRKFRKLCGLKLTGEIALLKPPGTLDEYFGGSTKGGNPQWRE